MGFLKRIHEQWKSMTPKQKFETVIHGVFDVGMDLLAGYALHKLIPANESKWKKATSVIAAGGLGFWAADAASKSVNEVIDVLWSDDEEDDDE